MLLTKNGYFNLHNIIFHPVDDIFIDAHFVGKSVEYQIMLFGIIKYFLIPFRNPIPTSFMESPQIFSFRGIMKPGLIRKERDFNEKFGIIVKAAIQQAANGDDGAITGLGYSVTAAVGVFVFSRKKSLLHFKKPVNRFKVLANAATNGCSEMATALVTGIITMMFNWTMLHYVGEDGVAAVTIIMYVLMFASSLYTGYSYGVAPMLSYYYGEKNQEKLKKW